MPSILDPEVLAGATAIVAALGAAGLRYLRGLTDSDEVWDKRIAAEGLHLKHDTQIVVMRDMHDDKRAHAAADRLRVFSFPDSVRWELKERGELTDAEIEVELGEQQAYYDWKVTRLREVVELLDKEAEFRADGKVERTPIGTTYYIDSDNGDDALNDGTTPAKSNGDGPWATLDQFTENARSAGDKAILRRGMTADYDDGTDLLFTSDGTIANPIIIEADYDDAWGDHVDLSATATATLTFGSKTITFASDISGVCAADGSDAMASRSAA